MAKKLRPKRISKRTPRRIPKESRRETFPVAQKDETRYEAEVLEGLVPFAARELEGLGVQIAARDSTSIQFHVSGNAERLKRLRTVVAVYRLEFFNVPRPKALLGHEHFSRLLGAVEEVKKQDTFASFRFSAAGSESAVFSRLAESIEKEAGLRYDTEVGDLLVRVRKVRAGWEVLLRTTARPLSSRPWRVCNLAGGLNATLAAAMVELVRVNPKDRFFNAMCGSGTLLIERGSSRASQLIGCDVSAEALACAQENVQASGHSGIELLHADATNLPFEDASFDVVMVDVPWGDAVGSHEENAALYPAFLEEMARIAAPGARLAVLTHDIRLFEKVLTSFNVWRRQDTVRVFHGGHYPRIYLFTRT